MLPASLVYLLTAAEPLPPEGGAAPPPANPGMPGFDFLFPMIAIIFIIWFLIMRPESRKRKDRERRVGAMKKGDLVVTTGGILGKVWRVEGNKVTLIIDKDKDVRVVFWKSAIYDFADADAAAPQATPEEVVVQPAKNEKT